MRRNFHPGIYSSPAAAVLVTVGSAILLALAFRLAEQPALPVLRDRGEEARQGGLDHQQILRRLPVSFEPNQGQLERQVVYRAQSLPGATSRAEFRGEYKLELHREGPRLISADESGINSIDLRFPGSTKTPLIEGRDQLPGRTSYFIGNERERWITDLPAYRKVVYRNMYAGIDLIFYGEGAEIEFDFLVAPGADPSQIRMEVVCARTGLIEGRSAPSPAGCGRPQVGRDGSLSLSGPGGGLELRRPFIYQEGPAGRLPIDGGYVIDKDDQVAFRLGPHNPAFPLVIDPIIRNSGFFGGSGQDTPYAITLDGAGNIYIAGQTRSSNFPVRLGYDETINGLSDAFVMKINPTGTAVLMSTFLGGRNPGDRILDVKVDAEGLIYVCGETSSLNFPLVTPFQSTYSGNFDGFVSILSGNGRQLVLSSYLGGSSQDTINSMALDGDGGIYLTGGTRSANFPAVRAFQPKMNGRADAFLARVDSFGALSFSTFLGGLESEAAETGEEAAFGVAIDQLGSVYLTGVTSAANFPLVKPFQSSFGGVSDCFIVKMRADGQAIIYSTFLGSSRADAGRAIAIDSFGQAVVTGYTFFRDFPTLNALQPAYQGNLDAFVAKLAANGEALLFSTFLGGSGQENFGSVNDPTPIGSIAVDRAGHIYVGGKTSSLDFPLLLPTQTALRGESDGFVIKLDPAGSSLLFSTYLGGGAIENEGTDERVTGLAVDRDGVIYVTGSTAGGNFPIILPFQSGFGGGVSDGFLTSIAMPDVSSLATVSAASFNGGAIAPDSMVALFGTNLAAGFSVANTIPLPEVLGGTRVLIEDSAGTVRPAGFFFASPGQINLHIPPGTAPGPAILSVSTASGADPQGLRAKIPIVRVAPAIFTANANGIGAPAAVIQRIRGANVSIEPVAEINVFGQYEPKAIDLGPETDEVYLILFGTGWRGVRSQSEVVVRIGGITVPIEFAGAQGVYVGLDQINIRLPRELSGRREVEVTLEVEGMIANIVRVFIL